MLLLKLGVVKTLVAEASNERNGRGPVGAGPELTVDPLKGHWDGSRIALAIRIGNGRARMGAHANRGGVSDAGGGMNAPCLAQSINFGIASETGASSFVKPTPGAIWSWERATRAGPMIGHFVALYVRREMAGYRV
jgi:hypothetical protein